MRTQSQYKQSGAALLLLMLVVIVAASSVLVTQMSDARLRLGQDRDTQAALAAAKKALISYAATYPDLNPGAPAQLPCPDIDAGAGLPDGEAHTGNCGATGETVLGRFPWRTVGTPVLQDASGACLWYALSGTYKSAAASTAPMINPDANGQLRLFSVETGGIVEGAQPAERPVAIVFAPRQPLAGQVRAGPASPGTACSNDFDPSAYLDAAAAIGVDNATVGGVAYAMDSFARSGDSETDHNDRLLTITREELAAAVYGRPDFLARMQLLTRGLASCVAAYGKQNPGGTNDARLPWPAAVSMVDYDSDNNYDDSNGSVFSGRLPDSVDDSNLLTGNGIARLVSDCDVTFAPDWDASFLPLWQHWKDHFFYTVAESFEPGAAVPSACSNCLSVNGAGDYAAIVLFAGPRLEAPGQNRDAPPMDTDNKQHITNYLEGRNAANHLHSGGPADYESAVASSVFNDIAFCIDATMSVAGC